MSVVERKARDRAQRERLIITAARELAESDGWDAVTTRRLAERIEYSQPVLYSHFAGKDAIVTAVALDGFTELAAALAAQDPDAGLAGVAQAYLAFADANPALYDAMFTMRIDLPFGQRDTPAPLQAGFVAIRDALVSGDRDADELAALAELVWSALHGIVTLHRTGRLPAESQAQRMALLVSVFG
ncbi:MAG TPA: TetR/AcrR family transcriptional regulator [Pseudonocardiaceae bacterium]|nr:TetR/AcrR family transcriptional regulator [Pseudonocardiaceae bacterium]